MNNFDKSLAVMQPYFFPYLGYFQLINAANVFVIYDNVEFTKKGWFHRNRLVFNGKIDYFTINIAKDSDFLDVVERKISSHFFEKEMPKILRKIRQNYHKAPYFNNVYPLIEEIFQFKERNLFKFLFNSLLKIIKYLEIDTEIIISSELPVNHKLKNKWRLFEMAEYLNANEYINPLGGHDLYDKSDFKASDIDLYFLNPTLEPYQQFNKEFVPGLSIIDVLMFNSKEETRKLLDNYELE